MTLQMNWSLIKMKEYILKRTKPQVTIQEEAKEDFKKIMNWTEEEFMKHVFVKTG